MPDLRRIASVDAPDRVLTPYNAALGGILLTAAVFAPMAGLWVSGQAPSPSDPDRRLVATRTPGTLDGTSLSALRTATAMPAKPTTLAERFAGPIVAGRQAAGVQLGTSVADALQGVPSVAVHRTDGDLGVSEFGIDLMDLTITIAADRSEDRIDRVSLTANSCADLLLHQTRPLAATLPVGLGIGTHESRISAHLGPSLPQIATAGVGHARYAGLGIGYCVDSLLVRRLTVTRDPSAHLQVPVPEPAFAGAMTLPGLAVPPVVGRLPPPAHGPDAAVQPVAVPAEPERTRMSALAMAEVQALPPHAVQPRDDADPRRSLAGAELAAIATTEAALPRYPHAGAEVPLSRSERRVIQLRLRLAGFDPKGVDGIFGPNTADAIIAFQKSENLPRTGLLDADTRNRLTAASADAWRAWLAERRLAARKAEEQAGNTRRAAAPQRISRAPEPKSAPECARDESGTIIENQSFGCDVHVLQEGIRNLFGLRG